MSNFKTERKPPRIKIFKVTFQQTTFVVLVFARKGGVHVCVLRVSRSVCGPGRPKLHAIRQARAKFAANPQETFPDV